MKRFRNIWKVALSAIGTCHLIILLIMLAAPPAMAQTTANPSGCAQVNNCFRKKNPDTGLWYCPGGACNTGCSCTADLDTGGNLAACSCK